ncbi:unnamed protein product, partial [Cylicostephanus goldi]
MLFFKRSPFLSRQKELCADREKKLQLALEEAIALDASMRSTAEWLTEAEQRLAAMEPVSRLVDVLEAQVAENDKWVDEVVVRKQLMAEQQAAGTRLQYYCEKKDAIPIKNGLVSLKHRFEKVSSRTADRTKQLNTALDEARIWEKGIASIHGFLDEVEESLPDAQLPTSNVDKLKNSLEKIKVVQADVTYRQADFDTTYKRGKSLMDRAPRSEVKKIQEINEKLRKRWNAMLEAISQRRQAAEQILLDSSAFDEAILELESWVDVELAKNAASDGRVHGDVETVKSLVDEHKKRENERSAKKRALDTIMSKAAKLSGNDSDENSHINGVCDRVNEKWKRLEEEANARSEALNDATKRATDFDKKVHDLLDWLVETE